MLNRSKRHIKASAKAALFWALAGIAVGVITDMTGYKKYRPYPEPKTITEIFQEWPQFIEISIILFVVTFIWQYCKTEKIDKIDKICPNCEGVINSGADETPQCSKCKIPLEDLDGFFERHPEKR